MQVFFFRSLVLLALFFLGSLVASLTAENYSALTVWFIAITAWTLLLGFRRALFIILPFLLLADVLWDGRIGELFLGGFLLATATTYLAVRIGTHSELLRWAIYSVLVSFFASLVVWISLAWPNLWLTGGNFVIFGKIFLWQLFLTLILYVPIFTGIRKIENFLDTSYQDQSKKIR